MELNRKIIIAFVVSIILAGSALSSFAAENEYPSFLNTEKQTLLYGSLESMFNLSSGSNNPSNFYQYLELGSDNFLLDGNSFYYYGSLNISHNQPGSSRNWRLYSILAYDKYNKGSVDATVGRFNKFIGAHSLHLTGADVSYKIGNVTIGSFGGRDDNQNRYSVYAGYTNTVFKAFLYGVNNQNAANEADYQVTMILPKFYGYFSGAIAKSKGLFFAENYLKANLDRYFNPYIAYDYIQADTLFADSDNPVFQHLAEKGGAFKTVTTGIDFNWINLSIKHLWHTYPKKHYNLYNISFYFPLDSIPLTMTAYLSKLDDPERTDGYHAAGMGAIYRLGKGAIHSGFDWYHLARRIYGKNRATDITGGVSYNVTKDISGDATIEYDKNPFYNRLTQVFFSLKYSFEVKK